MDKKKPTSVLVPMTLFVMLLVYSFTSDPNLIGPF